MEDYRELLELVQSGKDEGVPGPYSFSSMLKNSSNTDTPGNSDEIYGNIMKTEERVMDTIDRVVNHAQLTETASTSFLNQPVHVVLVRMIDSMKSLMEELVDARDLRAVSSAFAKDNRKIYLGLIIITLTIVTTIFNTVF